MKTRCAWAGSDPRMIAYHDEEWGVPCREERRLFEFLVLEGAQAGLSWSTVLYKREGYRAAFRGFDPSEVARFGPEEVDLLLGDSRIVRNRLKVESAVSNAARFLAVQQEFGGFGDYLWDFVGGTPVQNAWTEMGQLPASSALSDALSKDLRRRGFRFVGTTICYALCQAVGLVNDHLADCFRYRELGGKG